ncbi:hypothetical protein GOP47_0030562 [Adiantum capillus-veneris]|nr:hypothetical protein GOP47_0030562 [Adiantum capillus-veneris]
MSNEVQSDKLDEDKDTTTGAHEGVNDRKEEPGHDVLPNQRWCAWWCFGRCIAAKQGFLVGWGWHMVEDKGEV